MINYNNLKFKNEKQKQLFFKIANDKQIKTQHIYYNNYGKIIINCKDFTSNYFNTLTSNITKNDFIAIEKQKQKIIFF